MDKRRLASLERQIRQKTGRNEYPPPGFFKAGNEGITVYHEDLLRKGYPLESISRTPIFIE
jgi:hypothetical protein